MASAVRATRTKAGRPSASLGDRRRSLGEMAEGSNAAVCRPGISQRLHRGRARNRQAAAAAWPRASHDGRLRRSLRRSVGVAARRRTRSAEHRPQRSERSHGRASPSCSPSMNTIVHFELPAERHEAGSAASGAASSAGSSGLGWPRRVPPARRRRARRQPSIRPKTPAAVPSSTSAPTTSTRASARSETPAELRTTSSRFRRSAGSRAARTPRATASRSSGRATSRAVSG